jgi:hypothetical protein
MKRKRTATLTRALRGQLTRWRKGERVYVKHVIGRCYAIEKFIRNRKQGMIIGPGRRREGLACMNGLVGVRRADFEYDDDYPLPVGRTK